MASDNTYYKSPLAHRYSSEKMLYLFSEQNKYEHWRNLWIWLAEAQSSLGLSISQAQIAEMKQMAPDIDYRAAEIEERHTYNEVIAHANIFKSQCPNAAPIIHLGVSAFYITDNTDLIIFKNGLELLLPMLASIIYNLKSFAEANKDQPMLAFIHLQPTLLTTVGKRVCLWINDLLMDEKALRRVRDDLRFLGVKGIVGTQLNVLKLFNGDKEKVKMLDAKVMKLAGFTKSYIVTGQTYSRKMEVALLGALSSLGSSIHKICSDLRLLAFRKVFEEPFVRAAYKRYPIKSERCCSLARYLMTIYSCATQSHCNQWLEGSMDDSACRRLCLPEAFLCADAALLLLNKIIKGTKIYPELMDKHISEELAFMTVDNIVEAMVKAGVNQEECKEKMRNLINWIGTEFKVHGREHNMCEYLKKDDYFKPIYGQLDNIFSSQTYVGRASEQVTDFIDHEVNPVLFPYGDSVMLF